MANKSAQKSQVGNAKNQANVSVQKTGNQPPTQPPASISDPKTTVNGQPTSQSQKQDESHAEPETEKTVRLVSKDDRTLEANVNGVQYSGKSIEVSEKTADDVLRILKESGYSVEKE